MSGVAALILMSFGAVSAQHTTRQLLGDAYGFVPSGCSGLVLSVTAEKSDPSWFQQAPEIRGTVTLSNPQTYDAPISNVVVQAQSSDGLFYSTTANCDGSTSTMVPSNPEPYQYGTVTCRYRLTLDRRVFGSYGSAALGSSGSTDSGRGMGSIVGYFPSPGQRPSWTVTAVATVKYSNAQCLSSPTTVNTDIWWSWLSSWFSKGANNLGASSGRKLLTAAAEEDGEKRAHGVQAVDRHLLSSALDNCNGLIKPTGFIQANVDASYGIVGRVTLQNPSPVAMTLGIVQVTVANTIAFRPLFITADCHGATAVAAFSSVTCNYAADLPSEGQSARPAVWSQVAATATVGTNVACTSAAVPLINTVG